MALHIAQTDFMGWREAYRLQMGDAEMIVVTEVGPRILSLRVTGGPNLLYVDPSTAGQGQGDVAWHIYGGHRIWVSPESEDAYAPDNAHCAVQVSADGLSAVAPPDPDTKLSKRLTVRADGDRFIVESAVRNTSDFVAAGAVWALTCVVPQGVIAFPWGTGGRWAVKRIQWWTAWAGHSSNVRSQQYQAGPDLFVLRPTGEEGKVGTHSPEGWLALCRADATFIKSFTPDPFATYPDGGCSVEVYTCASFVEMETLSPQGIIAPGQELVHREVWTVRGQAVDPEDGIALRALLAH